MKRKATVITAIFAVLALASPCFADDLMKCQARDWVGQTQATDQKAITNTRQYYNREAATASKLFHDDWDQVNQVTPGIEELLEFQQRQTQLRKEASEVVADQENQEARRAADITQSAQNLEALVKEPADTPGVHLDSSSNLYVRNYR